MNSPAPIRGLLLSGGFSTRMGQDKGSLVWQQEPLVRQQLRRLNAVIPDVLISCREAQQANYAPFGELLIDQLPPHGPMSGLLTAFRHDATHAWLVLPVDMPFMDAGHLNLLIQSRDPDALATVLMDPFEQVLQPLVAIWEPAAHHVLEDAWKRGQFSLRRVLESNPVTSIQAKDASVLKNLHTPQDLGPTGPLA